VVSARLLGHEHYLTAIGPILSIYVAISAFWLAVAIFRRGAHVRTRDTAQGNLNPRPKAMEGKQQKMLIDGQENVQLGGEELAVSCKNGQI
jgi:hypothetical protein